MAVWGKMVKWYWLHWPDGRVIHAVNPPGPIWNGTVPAPDNYWTGPYQTAQQAKKVYFLAKRKKKEPKQRKYGRKVSGAEIVSEARSWLGVPYLYGGTTRQGVDCSGFVMRVAEAVGITSCPRTSEAQWVWAQPISEKESGAGDLVFLVGAELDPPPGHIGIIVSRGTMINAPFTGTVVRYDHYAANGTGVNRVMGYGRMQGATRSPSANPAVRAGSAQAAAPVPSLVAGGVISWVVVVLLLAFVVIAIGALIGASLLFSRG